MFQCVLQHSRSCNNLTWEVPSRVMLFILKIPEFKFVRMESGDILIRMKIPVSVSLFFFLLDRSNTEVFRQRKARVSVTCRFLSFGVSPHILVPVAGVALQQEQLGHTG